MTRLPFVTFDTATPLGQELWQRIIDTRGENMTLVNPDGTMRGPFGAMVARPDVGTPLIEVGKAIRFDSSIEPLLREVAICTIGAHWRSEFEFWAHGQFALAAGLKPEVLEGIASNDGDPGFSTDEQRAVHRYVHELLTTGRVTDQAHAAAHAALGDDGIVDLTHTVGYYSHICFLLNAYEIPLPPGETPRWDG